MNKKYEIIDGKLIVEGNYYNGSLSLYESNVTSLPEGLVVSGSLDLSYTDITTLPAGLSVGRDLDLSHTKITSLPDGLVVCRSLDLSYTKITSLPEGLSVGGWLDLSYSDITSLPDGLVVGGSLYLSHTDIASLPDGLVVGGSLDLSTSKIATIPKSLKTGGSIFTDKNLLCSNLQHGEYVPQRYLYADYILTPVKNAKEMPGGYVLYEGRIPNRNVVSDGTHYAHCETFREGIADILYKRAADRGAAQYTGLDLDTEMSLEDAKTMYRVITGACYQGTEEFANSVHNLKDKYTIREMFELTKGQYGNKQFQEFFDAD